MSVRNHFESSPDTGILGKNISRIWNLFEVYIFRFLIAGIFVSLILFPAAIIANTCLSLILSATAIFWNPISLILVELIKVLLYDFDKPYYETEMRFFPLFNITFSLLL